MFIRILEDGSQVYPYSLRQAKRDFKHVSFPLTFSATGSIGHGIYVVDTTPEPASREIYSFEELAPERNGGRYVQVWSNAVLDNTKVAAVRSRLKQRAKDRAGVIILGRIPSWKQSNFLALDAQLKQTKDGVENPGYDPQDPDSEEWLLAPRPWTVDEVAAWQHMMTEWTWAKSVRAASDHIEALIDVTAPDDLLSFDVEGSPLWP